eukprot:jgi/Psemu1/284657/fgenesh1_pg.59_\
MPKPTPPGDKDPRAVLYRNITGNAMTCAPLQDLLDLGYSVPDLERIQSEFLSIVVLDSKACPTMGVPVPWKIKDPSAPPQQQRRRDSLDGDGNPKRIYGVPRSNSNNVVEVEDPPDIQSPVWVNIDTFRDLLQKESDLRKMFLGEDWDRTIEQENNWRTDLYKKWLWSLHNGVGESIVPPTRTERARKLRRQGAAPPPQPRQQRQGRERNPRSARPRERARTAPEPRPPQRQRRSQDPPTTRRRRSRMSGTEDDHGDGEDKAPSRRRAGRDP